MQTLLKNMHYLCDEAQMLTGLTTAFGTKDHDVFLTYGRAQEIQLNNGKFVPCVRLLSEESIYDLASLTKFIVSVMTMLLVQEGKLSLNERIGEIDKRFIHLDNVSVFDVLCYRVCLQTPGRIDTADHVQQGLQRLFEVRQAPLPDVRIYSDINAMVIKYIVEAKTGMPLYDALKRYIFTPIGMNETYASVPEEKKHRCLCYNYEHRIVRDQYILRTEIPLGEPHDPKALLLSRGGRDLCGHAGLFSTRADMVRFAQSLLSNELLSEDLLREIGTNRTGRNNPDGTYRQPLGFLCFTKHPQQRLSEVPAYMGPHGMGISGFTGNHLVLDPDLGVFTLFLGNRCHGRVSHITPPEGITLANYNLDEQGAGLIRWNDGRLVPTSARYVYLKDAYLHDPIVSIMHERGWLA